MKKLLSVILFSLLFYSCDMDDMKGIPSIKKMIVANSVEDLSNGIEAASFSAGDTIYFALSATDSDLDIKQAILTQTSDSIQIGPDAINLPEQYFETQSYFGNIEAGIAGKWMVSVYCVDAKGNKSNIITKEITVNDSHIVDPPPEQYQETALLLISIMGDAGARTIMPNSPKASDITLFELWGRKGDNAMKEKLIASSAMPLEVQVQRGIWDLSLYGYKDNELVSENNFRADVSLGGVFSAAIGLTWITGQDRQGGQGTLKIKIEAPKGCLIEVLLKDMDIEALLKDMDDEGILLNARKEDDIFYITENVDSGYYGLNIYIKNIDNTRGVVVEMVHIYDNLTTEANFIFTESDFAK
jgi:hypothetical protein